VLSAFSGFRILGYRVVWLLEKRIYRLTSGLRMGFAFQHSDVELGCVAVVARGCPCSAWDSGVMSWLPRMAAEHMCIQMYEHVWPDEAGRRGHFTSDARVLGLELDTLDRHEWNP
jgi:hypothetical protein